MELVKIAVFVLCVIFMTLHEVNGCSQGEWTCANGQCIPALWKCDVHWVDCADGSDEVNCVFYTYPMLPDEAKLICENDDVVLTKVNSGATLDAALGLLQEIGFPHNVWVDGTVNFEYGLIEFSDGSSQHISEVEIWHEGEPNQSGTCLHLWNDGTGHKLDDTTCDYAQAFICGEPLPEIGGQLATPDEADAICASRGKTLYTVNTEHSLNEALSVLESNGVSGNAWVDGRKYVDVYRFTDKSMQWADDIPIWHDGEPNGSGECLHLWNNGLELKLDDTTCDYAQEFLCG